MRFRLSLCLFLVLLFLDQHGVEKGCVRKSTSALQNRACSYVDGIESELVHSVDFFVLMVMFRSFSCLLIDVFVSSCCLLFGLICTRDARAERNLVGTLGGNRIMPWLLKSTEIAVFPFLIFLCDVLKSMRVRAVGDLVVFRELLLLRVVCT